MMVASRRGDAQATEALKQINQELNQRREISKFQLAQLYDKGDEIPQDLPAAASLYRELAEEKDGMWYDDGSRYQLCEMYSAGKRRAAGLCPGKIVVQEVEKGSFLYGAGTYGRARARTVKNLRGALNYYKQAAVHGIPDGDTQHGNVTLASAHARVEKRAYFWYCLAAEYKFAGAEDKLHEVAAHLTAKEITEQRIQAAAWKTMREPEQFKNLKKH